MSLQRTLTVPGNAGTPVKIAAARSNRNQVFGAKAQQRIVIQPTADVRVGGPNVAASGANKGIKVVAGAVFPFPSGEHSLYVIADGASATDAVVVTY